MELGFLAIVLGSAAAGWLLRPFVSRAVARVILGLGAAALIVGVGTLWLMTGGALPIRWGGARVTLVSLVAAALLFPFGLSASYGRRTTPPESPW